MQTSCSSVTDVSFKQTLMPDDHAWSHVEVVLALVLTDVWAILWEEISR